MIETSTFSNGVHLVSNFQANTVSASVSIWLHNGSRHQLSTQNGYAHFLEHLLFKGTHRHNAKQLADAFEAMGGQINAETGRELTGFYGTVPQQDAAPLLHMLIDMLLQPRFNDQDVDVEKDIVLQEMAMVDDDPEEVLVETTTANIWPNNPIGWAILGDEQQIRAANAGDLHRYRESLLQGSRIWVVSAGCLSHEQLSQTCQALAQLPRGERPRAVTPVFTRHKTVLNYGIAQSCLLWDMPALPPAHPEFTALVMANHLLGGGTNSRLFQSVREERGLVYGIQSHLEIYSDCGLWSIQTSCEPENRQACFDAVEQCCERLIQQGPSRHEMDITRRFIKASLILESQNPEASMERLARESIYLPHIETLEEKLAKVDLVKPEEITKILAGFWQHRATGALTPEK